MLLSRHPPASCLRLLICLIISSLESFLAELEDRQLLVGEILRTSGDAEVSDGFQGGVQEKVKWGLFRTVKDYSIQNIV